MPTRSSERRSSARVATAKSLEDPAHREPRFAIGSRVRVLFDRLLYPGRITSVNEQRLFTVQFDDGELCDDVEESELRPERLSDDPVHKAHPGLVKRLRPSFRQMHR